MTDRDRPSVAEERAAAQARQRAQRAAARAEMAARHGETLPGRPLIVASWVGTAVTTVAAGWSATAGYDPDLEPPGNVAGAVVDLVVFAIGCLAFLVALYDGAQRSREAKMGIGGWFFLAGTAPGRVRAHLMGSLAVQVAVGVGAAAARPFSTLAFGILVPIYGLALAGIWGARHGHFPPREPPS